MKLAISTAVIGCLLIAVRTPMVSQSGLDKGVQDQSKKVAELKEKVDSLEKELAKTRDDLKRAEVELQKLAPTPAAGSNVQMTTKPPLPKLPPPPPPPPAPPRTKTNPESPEPAILKGNPELPGGTKAPPAKKPTE